MLELFERVCNAPGVSGFEDAVQQIAADVLAGCCDEVWRDRMGNVIAVKRAAEGTERPVRMLYAAHADEIGMMVSQVDEGGFVRFRAIGGLDPRTLPSQRVIVHGRGRVPRDLKGVVASHAGWLGTPEDRQRVFPVRELYVDLGMPRDEVVRSVEVGDVITFAAVFEEMNDKVVVARNFDDRAGVYCLLEAMKRMPESDVDVYAVVTVQEEVGVRGMPTAAHAIAPDIAVAIDGSLPSDTPYAERSERQCFLGKGTGIYIMDNRTIGTPGLVRGLIETCEDHGIPYQRNLGGGTDASAVQRAGRGAWATTIGAPTRYMHSTVQLCHLDDIEATIALLSTFPSRAASILPGDWQ